VDWGDVLWAAAKVAVVAEDPLAWGTGVRRRAIE
jgi:hypothetical protein